MIRKAYTGPKQVLVDLSKSCKRGGEEDLDANRTGEERATEVYLG